MALLLLYDEVTGFYAIDGERNVLPQISVQIDFTNDPTNPTRVWTDITPDIRALTYTRGGRDDELQRTSAGTLNCTLDNRTGEYDPTNTASPYWPGVKRMRWIRVRANWAGVVYPRWQGVIETWHQEWPEAGRDATATVTAVDVFKILNLLDIVGSTVGAQTTGQRVASSLNSVGVPTGAVDIGSTNLPAAGPFPSGTSLLGHLLDVEATENGLLFADGDGKVSFHDRHHRILDTATVIDTIGDAGSEIAYRTGELDLDDSDIFNLVTVTPAGGTPQVATNPASQTAHFQRATSQSSLSTSTAEALASAQYLVNRYADPSPRIPVVDVIGRLNTAKWPTILAAKNSDKFTWKRRASSNTLTLDVFVERVSDTVIPGTDWQVRFQLSPAVDQAGWVAGVAGLSEAGVTTRGVY